MKNKMQAMLLGFLLAGLVGCTAVEQTFAPAAVPNEGVAENATISEATLPTTTDTSTSTNNRRQTINTEGLDRRIYVDFFGVRVIDNNGDLWGWGDASLLGNNSTENALIPVKIMSNVRSILDNTTVVDDDNNLWDWSGGGWGFPMISWLGDELELTSTPAMIFENFQELIRLPTQVIGTGDNREMFELSYILTKNGQLIHLSTGVLVMENVKTTYTPLSNTIIFIITTDNILWGWGANDVGQLGIGTFANIAYPTQTPTPIMENVEKVVSTTFGSTFMLRTDGSVWATGRNHLGQLGNGNFENINTPQFIMDNVAYIHAWDWGANSSVFAITKDNVLYSWGTNEFGQLGNGTFNDRNTPTRVMENVIAIFNTSEATMFALSEDSVLWGWGRNEFAELGDGTMFTTQNTPVRIMDNVFTMVGGRVLTNNNELWAWGSNHNYRLGDGTSDYRTTPVHIMDNVHFIHDRFAITNDNVLWAWGENDRGQLGDGTFIDRNLPVRIMENVRIP